MRTIDTKKLSAALSRAEPSDRISDKEEQIHPYLLKHVIKPFLCGKSVMLADIDFSEFEPHDVGITSEAVGELSEIAHKSICMIATVRSIKPAAVKSKSYC